MLNTYNIQMYGILSFFFGGQFTKGFLILFIVFLPVKKNSISSLRFNLDVMKKEKTGSGGCS